MGQDSFHASDADDETGLATRAAWFYHAGGLTQSQVAEKLGVTNAKAHRLIARAARAGLVRVLVEGPIGGCIGLEEELSARFGLRFCRVVPHLDEGALPLHALGIAAATFLRDALEKPGRHVIGVGHGRTLAAAVDHLPRMPRPDVCFVSLLGGLPRRTSATPFDVIHRLAEKTGAEAYLLPVPFFANTAADRAVLLAQRGVAEALAMAAEARLFLVGVGEVAGDAFLPSTGMISAEESAALLRAGAVGEVLGRYLDAEGKPVETPVHDRVIALPPDAMRGRDVVAVAGGLFKAASIDAVLRSGLLTGLITDEPTARRLLDRTADRAAQKGSERCTTKPRISATPSSPAGLAVAS